MNEQMNSVR